MLKLSLAILAVGFPLAHIGSDAVQKEREIVSKAVTQTNQVNQVDTRAVLNERCVVLSERHDVLLGSNDWFVQIHVNGISPARDKNHSWVDPAQPAVVQA